MFQLPFVRAIPPTDISSLEEGLVFTSNACNRTAFALVSPHPHTSMQVSKNLVPFLFSSVAYDFNACLSSGSQEIIHHKIPLCLSSDHCLICLFVDNSLVKVIL
jgi:hypothetical protein